MPLPWMPKMARHHLLSHAGFTTLIPANRVVFTSPPDVTTPFVTIQAPGNNSLSGDDVAWSPLLQIDGWCPTSTQDAEEIVWDLAAAAASVFGRARNITYDTVTYSARLVDGPMAAAPDTSRGTSSPLCRALMRAELTVHLR